MGGVFGTLVPADVFCGVENSTSSRSIIFDGPPYVNYVELVFLSSVAE